MADALLPGPVPPASITPYRYALQLLAPAAILSQVAGRSEVTLEDMSETDSLFIDARRSARMLTQGPGPRRRYRRRRAT